MFFGTHRKSRDEIAAIQLRRLRRVLSNAYQGSVFYRNHYDTNGYHPGDLKHYDDIKNIPVVERRQLKDTPTEDLVVSADRKTLLHHTTSGASGIPVNVYFTRFERYKALYTVLRSYLLNGMKFTDTTVALRDPVDIVPQTFYQRLGILQYDYYNIYDPIDGICERILSKHAGIDILKAYPSDLVTLAYWGYRNQGRFPPVGVIYSDSEVLDAFSRNYVEEMFGSKVLDYYASVENGMIAFQCASCGKYHVNEDFVLLEPRESAALGSNVTEAVVTNLYNFTTPIIRYRIGDIVDFGDDVPTGDCHVRFKTINQVFGKYLDFIVLPDKSIISPHVPKQDLTHVGGIRRFQVIQETIDAVLIKIEKDDQYTEETEEQILKMMNRTFKNLVTVKIEYVQSVSRSGNRKFKVIESRVAQEFLTNA